MRKLTVLTAVIFITACVGLASAKPEAYTHYLSTTTATKMARDIGRKHHEPGQQGPPEIVNVHHLRRSAVDCTLRYNVVDPGDGYRTTVRFVVHAKAVQGGAEAVAEYIG